MRVGILTQYYPPEVGAPQARLSELAVRLVERGHEVDVLTAIPNYPLGRRFAGYGRFWHREELDGVRIHRGWIIPAQSPRMLPRLVNYFSFAASSIPVGMAVLPSLDYLLTESPPLFLGLSGWILSRLKCARWIFNVSDLWPDSAVHLGVVGSGFALDAARWLEQFCYRHAWLVSGQSREIVDSIESRLPGTPTYHFSTGVDPERFQPGRQDENIRGQLSPSGACVAIYAGLHGLAQGLDQILDAAALLREDGTPWITFVGGGPEKARLMNRARDHHLGNVQFIEPFPRERMPWVVASADIAIVPLKHRIPGAVPSKLYEAMGAGLPIVLVAEGEPARIVKEVGAGVVVRPGDVRGLADALRALAGDPQRRKQLGENGRRAALERYNRRHINDAFIDYLEARL